MDLYRFELAKHWNRIHAVGFSLLFLSILGGGLACTVQADVWRDPTVFRINKEPAHAEYILFTNRADAIKPLDLEQPWTGPCYTNLNGEWDFNWYPNINAVPEDWFEPKNRAAEWGVIPVPGCWQTYGYDRLYYMNTKLPFWYDMTGKNHDIRPEFTGDARQERVKAGYVPADAVSVGCYRKWVNIPTKHMKERVILRIGGVDAGVSVFVNGKKAGYSQDSMTPAEFNISPYLQPGENLIALQVYRWTDGSYLEIQDMVRFSGIFRDVFLRFEPLQRIRDLSFTGQPSENLKSVGMVYDVDVSNTSAQELVGASLKFELLANEGGETVHAWAEPIAPVAAQSEINVAGTLSLRNLKLWSPDAPNLYTLLASLSDSEGKVLQVVRIDTGFRRFENRDGNLYLNGQRFFIKGVNRHDHHAKLGRQVTLESMIQDLHLMKQNNINTVRTSHYPNDERWYYLCNRYGMALLDEANVESHEVSFIIPQSVPQWIPQSVDRVQNMVERDKNHPAVLIWSLGNEQGLGWCETFDAQYDRAKELDPTRLVMCDRGNYDALWGSRANPSYPPRNDKPDTITPMYGAVRNMEEYIEKRDHERRPFFMCEYRHAMGNAVGSLNEVWEMVYANENNGVNGGCIWDWVDQGVEAHAADGTTYYQYGGDWGDKVTEKNFCLNGLVLPDRSVTPKLAEVKKCYEPFTVKALSQTMGVFEVRNRLNQLSLHAVALNWQVRENGKVVQHGVIDTLNAPPGNTQTVNIPYHAGAFKSGREYYLRIGFATRSDTMWAKAGHEVTFSEFKLQGDYQPIPVACKTAPVVRADDGQVVVTASNGMSIAFDKTTGVLASLAINDTELLAENSRDRLFDASLAWIDNYINKGKNRLKEFSTLDLDNLKRAGEAEVSVANEGSRVVVTVKNTFTSPENAGFDEVQTWAIDGCGRIEVNESVAPSGKLGNDVWVPRLGLRLPLQPTLQKMEYYGLGPYGNYPDRKTGSWMGIHDSTAMANYVPYPMPQDCGNHEAVRWLTVADDQGNGLRIIAPQPLSMSVLPYTQDQLQKARHTIDLPNPPTTTELRIAGRLSGIGNGSCGPATYEPFRARSAPLHYRFWLVPFSGDE